MLHFATYSDSSCFCYKCYLEISYFSRHNSDGILVQYINCCRKYCVSLGLIMLKQLRKRVIFMRIVFFISVCLLTLRSLQSTMSYAYTCKTNWVKFDANTDFYVRVYKFANEMGLFISNNHISVHCNWYVLLYFSRY